MISDDILQELATMSDAIGDPVWESVVEDRDQQSGASFIQVGIDGVDRQTDVYLSVDRMGAGAAMHDLIATMRNSVPLLVAEVQAGQRGVLLRRVPEDALKLLHELDPQVPPPPWQLVEQVVDGKPESFIRVGTRPSGPSYLTVKRDLDHADRLLVTFIVQARNALPGLIAEAWRSRWQ